MIFKVEILRFFGLYSIPIGSMYGIFTYMNGWSLWYLYGFHVGKYTSPLDPMGYWNKPNNSIYMLMYQLRIPRRFPASHLFVNQRVIIDQGLPQTEIHEKPKPQPPSKKIPALHHDIVHILWNLYLNWLQWFYHFKRKRKYQCPTKNTQIFPVIWFHKQKVCRFSLFFS